MRGTAGRRDWIPPGTRTTVQLPTTAFLLMISSTGASQFRQLDAVRVSLAPAPCLRIQQARHALSFDVGTYTDGRRFPVRTDRAEQETLSEREEAVCRRPMFSRNRAWRSRHRSA